MRREVAYSPVADGQGCKVFSTEKRRDSASRADGTAARATRSEPPRSMPAVKSLNRRLLAAGGRAGAPGPCFRRALGRTGRREKHPADCKRVSSGACRVPVGAGPPLPEVGTAGNLRQPGGGGPGAGPPGRARTPGPASGRTQPERDGVARVPGGRPARDEGASGPAAAPPSEGS